MPLINIQNYLHIISYTTIYDQLWLKIITIMCITQVSHCKLLPEPEPPSVLCCRPLLWHHFLSPPSRLLWGNLPIKRETFITKCWDTSSVCTDGWAGGFVSPPEGRPGLTWCAWCVQGPGVLAAIWVVRDHRASCRRTDSREDFLSVCSGLNDEERCVCTYVWW